MIDPATLQAKFSEIRPLLNELQLRLVALAEAKSLGHGGIKRVAEACGLSRRSIERAKVEANREAQDSPSLKQRIRRPGGGRKKLVDHKPCLLEALDRLIDPETRGDPMSPLRWTSKSTAKLARELENAGYKVSANTVAGLLKQAGYSLQSVRKKLEGASHEDRDQQFHFINNSVIEFQDQGEPVVSIDAKKKELIGVFHNKGKEWQQAGKPEEVNTHDLMDNELGKVTPSGVCDILANEGWVSVGIDHDTAQFATETLRRWWEEMGRERYGQAKRLLITADGGGSNGVRLRLWKKCLQELATTTGLEIHVRHFPPGTSKWNKIEHRLFAQITHDWSGRPLLSREVVVNLIGSTTTTSGLKIKAALDEGIYPTKQKASDEEMCAIKITREEFHGEWNYSIRP